MSKRGGKQTELRQLEVDGLSVQVERSRRRSVVLTVTRDAAALLRTPPGVPDETLRTFVRGHLRFLESRMQLQRQQNAVAAAHPFDVEALRPQAERLVRERLAVYAPRMGLFPAGVRITGARTRWGSCSGKNRLCFSARIAELPLDAADAIVVHELAHLQEKNHGPRFYALVERTLPDYRRRMALVRGEERRLGVLGRAG